MSTHSTIALEYADGTVDQVYCHFDGYLSGVGAELQTFYRDPFDLQKLIDKGDMSTIGDPYGGHECWEDVKPRRFDNIVEFFQDFHDEEYNYLMRKVDGKAVWFVNMGKGWVELSTAKDSN